MKKILLLSMSLIHFFYASAFRIEYGSNVLINQPVYEDLYLAGGTITINAPVYGDLIIAGGTININDTVTNDILVLGGNVTFNGFAGDDIRCAGGKIYINKNVGGDVVVAGGEIVVDKGVGIGGLIASGGNVILNGDVKGDIKGAFGNLWLNGNVGRDIDCRGGKINVNGVIGGKSILAARYIVIENKAVFNNDVRYWTKQGSINFKQSLKNHKAIFDPSLQTQTGQWYYLGAATIFGLLWYLGMAFLMIIILQYLFSSTMKKAADTSFSRTAKSFGAGLLFFIAVPVAALIAFITIIGIPVGLLLLVSFITIVLLTTVIIAIVITNWFNNRYQYNWGYWKMILIAFSIFILLKLGSLLPFAGWPIIFVLACIVFGAILLNIKWNKHSTIRRASEKNETINPGLLK